MWVAFLLFIVILLALDLGVFHKRPHAVGIREALGWSGVWVAVTLLFNVFVYFAYDRHWLGMDIPGAERDGPTAAVLFFTGYVIEKSLSLDNVFVIALLFSSLGVPSQYQHRVLFWGIFGALVMRGVMILCGAVIIEHFHWVLYFFGAFLIFTAAKMLFAKHDADPAENRILKVIRRWFPVTDEYHGQRFLVRVNGRQMLTPLAVALVLVESTDLIFAADSIPAIFAITEDAFLVFSSNVFAILGLRALFFALAGTMNKFHYLKLSLAVLLGLIGLKMVLKDVLHEVPGMTYYTLGTIVLVLGAGVVASLIRAKRMRGAESSSHA
jgi:tellurite resistance protein TerC